VVAAGTFEPLPADVQVKVTRSPAAKPVLEAAVAEHVLPVLNEHDAIDEPPFLAKATVQLPWLGAVSAYATSVFNDMAVGTTMLYVLADPPLGLGMVPAPLTQVR
jgi:hypothetical protein